MHNFVKKIKLDDTLTELFLSFLLKEKYCVPSLDREQENLISFISESFLMSGFILKSCDFGVSQKSLVDRLKYQRKIQLLKHMSVKNDLNNIARNLNEQFIKHVVLKGVALNSDGIYKNGLRASRDIDLLVSVDQLSEAYNVLKTIGFRYPNKKTEDSVKYHFSGNHFCVMVNENGTKLELHWRVTTSIDFKNCPFTANVFADRRVSNTNPHIFCPKIETTIAHLMHHNFAQHRLNLGPIFLFDLAAIFSFYHKKWPIDNDLHKKLGIDKNFELCKKLIERASGESSFSSESKLIVNKIFKNSHWLRLSYATRIPTSLIKTTRVENVEKSKFLSKLLFKVRYNRTLYQVSYCSVKFWVFLVSDILSDLRKVMRGYFN